MRVMIDTMIFDRILAMRGLTRRVRRLVKAGSLTILTTHVQEDELTEMPSWWKRLRIARIPRVRVATSDFVWDRSKWGQARWGAGERLEQIRGTVRHTADGLIGATAAAEADVLVTEDGRLARRAARVGAEVWDFSMFAEWVTSQ